ncbi:recombinase family protein [Sedimenticola selenatireducens]|uniref:recombinase family protein n=1 Tax=Sedimenticola selenatireducens TaxID=191960 RepID=UPI002AAB7F63|nr:recombinase family protein [Sedimenticola selenatireducens]
MLVGYARVSSQDQNPDLQLDALEKAGCEQVFIEEITTTGKKARPKWEVCSRVLRKGDILMVWRLDRLGRSLKDLVEIMQDLDERGIGFKSLTESIDTGSAGGKLIFHIFGALAEFEYSLIRERAIAGIAAGRARGRKGGRKPKLTKAAVKKAAAMLRDPMVTKTEVAEHFGVTRMTLNKALEREGYPQNPAAPEIETTKTEGQKQ